MPVAYLLECWDVEMVPQTTIHRASAWHCKITRLAASLGTSQSATGHDADLLVVVVARGKGRSLVVGKFPTFYQTRCSGPPANLGGILRSRRGSRENHANPANHSPTLANFSAHRNRTSIAWGNFVRNPSRPASDQLDNPRPTTESPSHPLQHNHRYHGPSSQQGQGHLVLRHPLLAQPPRLAQDHPRAGRRPDLQARQEGRDPLADRCRPP